MGWRKKKQLKHSLETKVLVDTIIVLLPNLLVQSSELHPTALLRSESMGSFETMPPLKEGSER